MSRQASTQRKFLGPTQRRTKMMPRKMSGFSSQVLIRTGMMIIRSLYLGRMGGNRHESDPVLVVCLSVSMSVFCCLITSTFGVSNAHYLATILSSILTASTISLVLWQLRSFLHWRLRSSVQKTWVLSMGPRFLKPWSSPLQDCKCIGLDNSFL